MKGLKKLEKSVKPVSPLDYFLVSFAVVCWGGTFAATKYAIPEANPLMIVWWRLFFSIPMLFLVTLFEKHLRLPSKKEAVALTVLSLQGILFHQGLQGFAMRTAGATTSNWIIILVVPVMVALIGHFFLNEKITRHAAAGFATAIAGVILVVQYGTAKTTGENIKFGSAGDFMILLSGLNLAIYYIISKWAMNKTGKSMSGDFMIFWEMLISLAGCTIVLPIFGVSFKEIASYTMPTWYALLYLGVFASALAYFFWFRGFEVLPANKVVVFQSLQPIAGSIISYFLIGERFTLWFFIGALLVLAGIHYVNDTQTAVKSR